MMIIYDTCVGTHTRIYNKEVLVMSASKIRKEVLGKFISDIKTGRASVRFIRSVALPLRERHLSMNVNSC